MAFKRLKVFDCQDMPAEVKREFFAATYVGNDCYVSWAWHVDSVNAWLIENGAKENEELLINHWW